MGIGFDPPGADAKRDQRGDRGSVFGCGRQKDDGAVVGFGESQETTQKRLGRMSGRVGEIDDDEAEGAASKQLVGGAKAPMGIVEADQRQSRPVQIPAVGVGGIKERGGGADPGGGFLCTMGLSDEFDGQRKMRMATMGAQLGQPAAEIGEIEVFTDVAAGVEKLACQLDMAQWKHKYRGQKTGVREQKTENRGQRTEGRKQGSEVRKSHCDAASLFEF